MARWLARMWMTHRCRLTGAMRCQAGVIKSGSNNSGNTGAKTTTNKPSSKLLLPTSWRLVFHCSKNQRHIVCLFGFYSSPLPPSPSLSLSLLLSLSSSLSPLWNWFSLPTNKLCNFIFHQAPRKIHVCLSFVVVVALGELHNCLSLLCVWGGV